MIRFGVIGTSKITRNFLDAAKHIPELKLYCVYSRAIDKAREFAAEFEAEVCYDDLEQMAIDTRLDGVYIASPNICHSQQALIFLNAGKHVICEKPIATNYDEFEQMQAAADRKKVVLLEAMRPVFDPGFWKLEEYLQKIGPVRQATLQFCQYSSRYDEFKAGIIHNIFKPEMCSGALMDIGVYCVYMMVHLFGLPHTILSDSVFLSNGVDGAGSILANYGQMQVQLIYSKITQSHSLSQIQGEKGAILFGKPNDIRDIRLVMNDGHRRDRTIEKNANNMFYEILEWVRLINSGNRADRYLQSSADALKVMDQVRKQAGLVYPTDR